MMPRGINLRQAPLRGTLFRITILAVIAILLTALAAAAGFAQDEENGEAAVRLSRLDPATIPSAMIDGIVEEIISRSSTSRVLGVSASDPTDSCSDAPNIALSPNFPADGVSFDTQSATAEDSDPVLNCMWGGPSRAQGYRTVWYRLVAPISGTIDLDTFSSQYDTVLGVYSTVVSNEEDHEECDFLTLIRCSDDVNGFASQSTIAVSAGDVLYIEVADWSGGVPEEPTLNFSAVLQPVNSLWQSLTTKPLAPAVSRHATVAQNEMLYVIGGQTGGPGVPFVSNTLWRLNTTSDQWQAMSPMPGPGYSNATAALLNGKIYLPSGFTGNELAFDGRHWVYDMALDAWSLAASIPNDLLPSGETFAYTAAAVPPSNDRYYLMGGTSSTSLFDSTVSANDEAYLYVAASDKWQPIDAMTTARYAHTGAWIAANNLGACVAGGISHEPGEEEFIFQTATECYTPLDGWRTYANINIPRIGAGSAVGPDGKWYVFGGLTPFADVLLPVLRTEVFDPVRNTWSLLPPRYNLGNQELLSARAFARGSLIGNDLYVAGGSIFVNGENAVPIVERIELPDVTAYLPSLFYSGDPSQTPDDNMAEARSIGFDTTYVGQFDQARDFYDFYVFSVTTPQTVKVNLKVPKDNDFDLFLYGSNKLEWNRSAQPFNGADETIEMNFPTLGAYFIMVQRSFPTAQPDKNADYELTLTRSN